MPEFPADHLDGASQFAHNLWSILTVLRMEIGFECGGLDQEQRAAIESVIADANTLATDLIKELEFVRAARNRACRAA